MVQGEISFKERSVVAVVEAVEEGRVSNPDDRLDRPTSKIVGSGFGTGPLPLFLDFLFREAFGVGVESEREGVVSD